MKLKIILPIILILGILATIALYLYPKTPIISGYTARMMCSCHLGEGMPVSQVLEQDLNYNVLPYADIDIDAVRGEVTSSFFGMSPKTAVYLGRQGCVLVHDKDKKPISVSIPEIIDSYHWKTSLSPDSTSLDKVWFDKKDMTRAVIVLHHDTIVYEQYASDVNPATALLGWSMTKSVISTLVGMAISDGSLSLDQNHLYPQWKGAHSEITLEDLLQMRSGVAWSEVYDKVSSATSMLYDEADMVRYLTKLDLEATPGTHWEYSSANSNLLADVLRRATPDSKSYYQFPYRRLFEPLGMSSAFIELDQAGTMVGSSYMYASARDWAKYGLLYLQDGKWEQNQVLDSTWVTYTQQAEPLSEGVYGNQFWQNKGGVDMPDVPHDTYYADGYQGQRVFIIPSKNLVIVRLGLRNMDFNQALSKTIQILN